MNNECENNTINKKVYINKIAELESQIDNLISNMSFGFFLYEVVVDSRGKDNIRVLMVNKAMADFFHKDKQELVGKLFEEFWPDQRHEKYLNLALQVAKTGESFQLESFDESLDFPLGITMYRPKTGQVAVIAIDRTPTVKAEAAIERAYKDISTLLSEIPAPICVVCTGTGCILNNNPAFADLCGAVQGSDMAGEFIQTYLSPEAAQGAELKVLLAGTEDFAGTLRKKNGEEIQVKLFSRSLRYQNEDAFAIHFINLTKQHSDEKALRDAARDAAEASAFKSSFLANMSHELRTPMNGVIGFAELALRDGNMNPAVKNYLVKIKESGENLLGIINDILDVSKIESGKVELEMTPFDLHDIFRQCETVCSIKAMEKGVLLSFYADPAINKALVGDPAKIRQTLMNLLTNAIKFTPKGSVALRATIENEAKDRVTVLFEVQDSGIGMTPEQLEKVFKPFTQADVSTTRNYGGTGLGLSICKNFVAIMGGELGAVSVPGGGSTFSFAIEFETRDFPEEASPAGPAGHAMEPPRFTADILVCEDNEINQEVIAGHLAIVGITPAIVSNGKLGIETVKERAATGKPFDLIFMDVSMPVMDGVEAAARIKAMGVKTPIIALTANAMAHDKERYLRNGMDGYLPKPFVESDLWQCLLRYLRQEGEPSRAVRHAYAAPPSDAAAPAHENGRYTVVDAALGLSKVAGNAALYEKVTQRFFETSPAMLAEFEEALAASDGDAARRICHTMAGLAGTIGAARLQGAAQNTEYALIHDSVSHDSDMANIFRKELELVLAALERRHTGR